MNDFKKKVVYQIYPKSFKDTNGTGTGDLKGVIEKLDYLQTLGVDYIWLTPFYVSSQNDNGYDVADYYNIDPSYGTMEDVENLIAEAKKRNIYLMMDMVFNHVSTEHIWFKKAMAGEEKYLNYFFFKQGKANNQPPTNWNPLKMVKNQITGDQFLEVQYGKRLKEEMNIISMLFLKNNLI